MWLNFRYSRFQFFHLLIVIMACVLLGLSSCKDKCEQYVTYRQNIAVPLSVDSIRAAVMPLGATSLKKPGKIYVKDNWLFVNEKGAGVHIIDNTDKENPVNVAFLQIPGNQDVAVKGNILYAQSYMDLLAFDISNARHPELVERLKAVLSASGEDNWYYSSSMDKLVKYDVQLVTSPMGDCHQAAIYYDAAYQTAAATGFASPVGTGGSNARFAIQGNYLYTVTNNNMQLFNISNPAQPDTASLLWRGGGLETVFPFENYLLIGSNSGVNIYDISSPDNPVFTSSISHICRRDPVVADGDYAYYTLHPGAASCNNEPRRNELDVVDISNIKAPQNVISYSMEDPEGLGVNNKYLFVCEGDYGLKIYDKNYPLSLSKHLILWRKDIPAYDVIPTGNQILVVGSNGLYQFDISDPEHMKQLSKITIDKT